MYDYDEHFGEKLKNIPSLSLTIVDEELILLNIYSTMITGTKKQFRQAYFCDMIKLIRDNAAIISANTNMMVWCVHYITLILDTEHTQVLSHLMSGDEQAT